MIFSENRRPLFGIVLYQLVDLVWSGFGSPHDERAGQDDADFWTTTPAIALGGDPAYPSAGTSGDHGIGRFGV